MAQRDTYLTFINSRTGNPTRHRVLVDNGRTIRCHCGSEIFHADVESYHEEMDPEWTKLSLCKTCCKEQV